jgi:hypothetical protein
MKEITQLNKRLLVEAKEHLPEEGLMLHRKNNDDELKKSLNLCERKSKIFVGN